MKVPSWSPMAKLGQLLPVAAEAVRVMQKGTAGKGRHWTEIPLKRQHGLNRQGCMQSVVMIWVMLQSLFAVVSSFPKRR